MNVPAGRPRDASVEARVVKATIDTIHEVGLSGLSIDGIAARAGVGKATIYRRWASKDELLVDAVVGVATAGGAPDTGDIRSDLIAFVTEMRALMCDSRVWAVFPWLAGEIAGSTPLGKRYADAVIAPTREQIATVVQRGIDRGELRDDLDVGIAVDMIIGTVVIKRLSGGFQDAPRSWQGQFVDTLLHGWDAGIGSVGVPSSPRKGTPNTPS